MNESDKVQSKENEMKKCSVVIEGEKIIFYITQQAIVYKLILHSDSNASVLMRGVVMCDRGGPMSPPTFATRSGQRSERDSRRRKERRWQRR